MQQIVAYVVIAKREEVLYQNSAEDNHKCHLVGCFEAKQQRKVSNDHLHLAIDPGV